MLAARDRHGFLQAEMMVSMTVLGVLAICIAVTAHGVQRVHQTLAARHRCIAAAQAQIESIVARDQPIAPDKVAMLWPGCADPGDTRRRSMARHGVDKGHGLGPIGAEDCAGDVGQVQVQRE